MVASRSNVGLSVDASRSNMELGGDSSKSNLRLGVDTSGPTCYYHQKKTIY